ncbi:DUF397 domain-containing protein [Streptomyces sp. NPDC088801]|uniref:DUF397 domain-containing protein n=1 Tax=Streptomyces sp. NPDC088801 TaxID=3365903 RepID=UPI0038249B25
MNSRPQPERWITATDSQAQGECVEVGFTPGTVHTRDSKNRNGPALTFTPESWQAFTATLKARRS